MTKVTDEMLMAYVDGELDQATTNDVRRAVETDAALGRRADAFRSSGRSARDAIASIRAEPVPERLIEAVLGNANANVAPVRRGWTSALPLAACIALIAGLSGYWLAVRSNVENDLLGNQTVAEALRVTPAGSERTIRTAAGPAQMKTLGTYRVDGGLCRTFELSESGRSVRGLGCSRDGNWRINVAVAGTGSGSYAPASAPAAIDAFLDAVDAKGPLSAEEEAALEKAAR